MIRLQGDVVVPTGGSKPVKASEIVRVGLVAILAVLAFKLVAYKLNIPGLRNAAAML